MNKPNPDCSQCHGSGSHEHDFIDMIVPCECVSLLIEDPYVRIITETGGELIEYDPRLVRFKR